MISSTKTCLLPRSVLAVCLLVCSALLLLPSAAAADKELNAAGTLHSVLVESRSTKGSNPGGMRLVHRVQTANESLESMSIPGTDEPAFDLEPAISLSPSTGLPALVWRRFEGPDYEIYLSIYDGGRWGTPRAITANSWDDFTPQIVWGRSGYIHVVWHGPVQADGAFSFYESILDAKGLTVVPATQILLHTSGTVSQSSSPPPVFTAGDLLVAGDSGSKLEPRLIAYGGIDEPIPVAARVDFVLPAGSSAIERAKIETVGSNIAVIVKSGSRLFYAIQSPTGWTTLRTLTLSATLTEEQGEIAIKAMIGRTPLP